MRISAQTQIPHTTTQKTSIETIRTQIVPLYPLCPKTAVVRPKRWTLYPTARIQYPCYVLSSDPSLHTQRRFVVIPRTIFILLLLLDFLYLPVKRPYRYSPLYLPPIPTYFL
jgi:hypothetical protein